MISLPTYQPTARHTQFATDAFPLRPSSTGKLFACPMSVFMTWIEQDGASNGAADTGSMVHAGAAAFHRTEGDLAFRKGAGEEALASSQSQFPLGDLAKAREIYGAYADDPKNQSADVVWVEQKVRLHLPPAPNDPTGQPVVFEGTLDQVRRFEGGLQVWDIKTGEGKDANESLAEYLLQQVVYTLAARETLDPTTVPGGLIYTPGYKQPRGRRFLPLGISVDQCTQLLAPLVHVVSLIRQGVPLFTPSAAACKYCPVRPYTNCLPMYQGVFA